MKNDSVLSFRMLVWTLDIADGFPVLACCQFEDYWFNRATPGEQLQKGGSQSDWRDSAWARLNIHVCEVTFKFRAAFFLFNCVFLMSPLSLNTRVSEYS